MCTYTHRDTRRDEPWPPFCTCRSRLGVQVRSWADRTSRMDADTDRAELELVRLLCYSASLALLRARRDVDREGLVPAAIVDRARAAPELEPTLIRRRRRRRPGAELSCWLQPGLNSEQRRRGGRRLWQTGSVTRMRFRCTTTVCERNGASQNVSADKSWFLVSVWSQNFRATSCPGTNQQTIRHLEQVHQRYCREDSPARSHSICSAVLNQLKSTFHKSLKSEPTSSQFRGYSAKKKKSNLEPGGV